MSTFRVFKQLKPSPQKDLGDVDWARRNVWVARTGSEQIWEFSGSNAESNALSKMNELSGSDDSGRLYKVIKSGV